MKFQDLCSGCNVSTPSGEHRQRFERIGIPERTEGGGGTTRWLEETWKYKCPECGALWEHLVESGATGHGSFWTRIDPPESK